MTNIKCKGGKEIDLLAVNPVDDKRYHIEARVSTTLPLRLKETKTKNEKSNKDGVDYFAREKFNHLYVVEKIKQFFGNKKYERILVVHDTDTRGYESDVRKHAMEQFGIQICYISELINDLKKYGTTRGSRDDILRLLELISLDENERAKQRRYFRTHWERMRKENLRRLAKLQKEMKERRKQ